MGVQCTIIISFYTERKQDEIRNKIVSKLDLHYFDDRFTDFERVIGNRAFGPSMLSFEVVCMKDWFEPECREFIESLKKIDWEYPETVQIYWSPATHENYELFRYQKLF